MIFFCTARKPPAIDSACAAKYILILSFPKNPLHGLTQTFRRYLTARFFHKFPYWVLHVRIGNPHLNTLFQRAHFPAVLYVIRQLSDNEINLLNTIPDFCIRQTLLYDLLNLIIVKHNSHIFIICHYVKSPEFYFSEAIISCICA